MSGGYDDALLHEGLGDGCPGILLGGEGKELHETGSGIEETLGVVHGSRANVFRLVSPDEAWGRIEKRSLDVKTGNDLASQFVQLAKPNDLCELGSETLNAVGNESGEDAAHPVVNQGSASVVELLARKG